MTRTEIEAAIYASLRRTARWRQSVAKRFPSDPRNHTAVERLGELSKQIAVSAEQCGALFPHFDASERWNEVLSDTSRAVGMPPGFQDFTAYAEQLIGALR